VSGEGKARFDKQRTNIIEIGAKFKVKHVHTILFLQFAPDKQLMRALIFITPLLALACRHTDKRFQVDFDSFSNGTTLTLESYSHDNSDCGEFGGHKETILIKKEKNELTFYYKRDSTNCPKELAIRFNKELDRPTEIKGRLSGDKHDLIQSYLDELLTHEPTWNNISNAPNSYEVRFSSEFRTLYFQLSPVDKEWKAYITMRNNLIK